MLTLDQPRAERAVDEWVLRMPWSSADAAQTEPLITREWLVTNGLGGYASGTVSGVASRRYHGLLVAALPAPLGNAVKDSRPRKTGVSRKVGI